MYTSGFVCINVYLTTYYKHFNTSVYIFLHTHIYVFITSTCMYILGESTLAHILMELTQLFVLY